uniref:Protein kinase domain-containing protein n=1 Tax=Oryzias sinensis TaxID=183150 RepID=A0A8C7WYN7_9TELE
MCFSVQKHTMELRAERAYFVERFLGEGTFGKVAKCTNLSTNEEVAIKIIKNGFNKTFVEWFHYNSH